MENEKLAETARAGNKQALLDLWESVRRLCLRIAARYGSMLTRAGLDAEDIAQECFLALCKAIEAFDSEGGYRFTTYLTYHVKNALRAALGIRDGKALPPAPVSLDSPLGDDEECTRGDLLPDSRAEQAFEIAEDSVWNAQLHSALEQCLDELETGQAKVIRGVYYENMTAKETGKLLGLSASQTTQLKQAGLRKLRHGKNLKRLKQYRDDIASGIYFGTSLSAWRYGGASVEERTILRLEELENPTPAIEPKT